MESARSPVRSRRPALTWRVPLMLAGAGATSQLAAAVQATQLFSDPVTAAEDTGGRQLATGPSYLPEALRSSA